MKKRWMAVLVASVFVVGAAQPVGASEGNIAVTLEGKAVVFDPQPEVIHDRTMVPVRAIFEALGGQVQWKEATQTVTAVQGDTTIQLKVGSSIGKVNDEYYDLDAAPLQKNDRILVPLRFIAEALYQMVL
ncbi:copper amine oxidase N-terminal domain-containing protein [Tumebacillus sp. ITR2]|uniref:Copper amine oxidase N-terminal domain-containing protein n=1 Tax=Tumebacillus amylolyticus TaxID=2801339 RepID=A0ABS1JDY3_9BACL|nr:copper amine oxidase N-terminal domain-containing protein [Tumebacillus amylolyticus]MBL0388496.1 copper amine oxidase N-terminal domain-containing protein [Tumebacillus amylolyticus]